VLVGEWDRQSHRVMVLADGFAWSGTAPSRSPAGAIAERKATRAWLRSIQAPATLDLRDHA
jgi:hypothetical protein